MERPDDVPPGSQAITSETYVTETNGRWIVEIVVVFPDEVVRKTINDYPTKRQAEIAASWIKRTAQRDIEGPVNG